jgi:hypothetical protein
MSNLNYTAIYSVNNTDLPSPGIKDYIRIHSYGKTMFETEKNNDQSQVKVPIFGLRIPTMIPELEFTVKSNRSEI